ncbi:MAG: tRNA (adenosine(37)-N6)-threonylcarbamoyltransferase complex dimerization subunit type 1 TsaB [Hyphomicrobiales bacterium]|nr:tRNA (adenosine(37)-N6)-threonylcarbamoyltransferase complex dimerization subunit type 1 TsaB [Hyphomicrobiales bacterium]
MIVLAVETSMGGSSVAVMRRGDASPMALQEGAPAREQAENLMPLIDAALREARVAYSDIGRLAASLGPGSFSGVRASLAAIYGVSIATGAPVVGVSSLEIMARKFAVARGFAGGPFFIAAPAGREAVYGQAFHEDAAPAAPPALIPVALWSGAMIASGVTLAGPAATALSAAAADAPVDERPCAPDAATLARMALERTPTPGLPAPLYLRAADAKPQMSKVLPRAAS